MAQFALSGLVVVILLGVVGTIVLRRLATSEAIRDARELTQVAGNGILEPALSPGVLAGDPRSLTALDRIVRARVLRGPVVRVKLWTSAGRIVYSDEPRLIGAVYPLETGERVALETGRAQAALSDLSSPENRFDRSAGKLLEVYLPVRAPGGGRLLFEQYLRYSSVAASGRKIWLAFLPALVAGLVLLELMQVPLAWSMARRLRQGQLEREALLQRAIESSRLERRRIAQEIHDDVVQDLAGLSFSLAATADRLEARAPASVSETLRQAAGATRESMRRLRSLLVEIYPPNLQAAGLEAALSDTLAPAAARGIETILDIPDDLSVGPEAESLLFRTAQEAVRNALAHSQARRLEVRVRAREQGVELVVEDDGRGFSVEELERQRDEGHLGLALLADLAVSAGGRLEVDSSPGRGTRIILKAPAP